MDKQQPPGTSNPRHEMRDIHPARVAIIGAVLLILIGLVGYLSTFWLFRYETKVEPGPEPSPLVRLQQPPPPPRLQFDTSRELELSRAQEESQLHSYGWVDRSNGVVRIPIERAMELLLERGLPRRPDGLPETGGETPPRDGGEPHGRRAEGASAGNANK